MSAAASSPFLILALFAAACFSPRSGDETGSTEIASIRFANGELDVQGGNEQERLLARALLGAMARASRAEAELEELRAYCPRQSL